MAVYPSPFYHSVIAYGVGAGTEEHSRHILRGHLWSDTERTLVTDSPT